MDLRRVILNRKITQTTQGIESLINKLNLAKDVSLKDVIKLINDLNNMRGLITEVEKARLFELEKLRVLKEDLIVQGKKLSGMVGQARLSFSMMWSMAAQTSSMIQRIAADSNAEWVEVLGQGMSVLSNIIAIAFASAAVWAGTGPAGVAMASMQIANASIAMALQAQASTYQSNIRQNNNLNAEISIGDEPM